MGHPTVEKSWENFVALGYETPAHRPAFERAPAQLYGGAERSLAFAVKTPPFFYGPDARRNRHGTGLPSDGWF